METFYKKDNQAAQRVMAEKLLKTDPVRYTFKN
jgi:hypothetical protein